MSKLYSFFIGLVCWLVGGVSYTVIVTEKSKRSLATLHIQYIQNWIFEKQFVEYADESEQERDKGDGWREISREITIYIHCIHIIRFAFSRYNFFFAFSFFLSSVFIPIHTFHTLRYTHQQNIHEIFSVRIYNTNAFWIWSRSFVWYGMSFFYEFLIASMKIISFFGWIRIYVSWRYFCVLVPEVNQTLLTYTHIGVAHAKNICLTIYRNW